MLRPTAGLIDVGDALLRCPRISSLTWRGDRFSSGRLPPVASCTLHRSGSDAGQPLSYVQGAFKFKREAPAVGLGGSESDGDTQSSLLTA